ncbi:MAG: DUF3108 domain-containing protein [bacterium]
MRRIFFIIIFIFLRTTICADELPFGTNDKLTYEVRLFGFKIGSQIDEVIGIEELNTQQTYHLRSTIKSNPFFSHYYYLSEQLDSWVQTSTLLPVLTIKDIDRKKYHKHYISTFDHINQKAVVFSQHTDITRTIDIFPNTRDFLSLIYYLRNQDLKVGNSYLLSLLTSDEVEKIKVNIVKEEMVSTPAGRFKTLKVIAGTDIIVWFTIDKTHIPVKIEIKTEVGQLKAYLGKKE